jgi:hypothetical protein
MPSAWIDNHDWRFLQVDAIIPAVVADFGYSQQRVVGGMLEAARIEQCLVFEVEQRWQTGTLVLEHIVRSPPQRIPE